MAGAGTAQSGKLSVPYCIGSWELKHSHPVLPSFSAARVIKTSSWYHFYNTSPSVAHLMGRVTPKLTIQTMSTQPCCPLLAATAGAAARCF